MLPWKMLIFMFGLTSCISGIGYWFFAGYGALFNPSDTTRTLVTVMFVSGGLISLYAIARFNLLERNERISQDPAAKNKGNLTKW